MASVVHAILRRKRKWWGYYRTPEERAAILEGLSTGEQEGLIKQGRLEKRGARLGDAWNPRWVTLTQDELCYYYYEQTTSGPGAVIDTIPIQEVEVRGLAWGCTCSLFTFLCLLGCSLPSPL